MILAQYSPNVENASERTNRRIITGTEVLKGRETIELPVKSEGHWDD
jgi:hypothetical protein